MPSLYLMSITVSLSAPVYSPKLSAGTSSSFARNVKGNFPLGFTSPIRTAAKQKKVKPLFPFGHGLSYTTFEYGKPTVDSKVMTAGGTLTVKVTVSNTGAREGQEVVQLYISDKKSSLPRPVKELKGFQKIKLAPGEVREVSFVIDREALSFFDDARHTWVAEPGRFEAVVAASATDVRGVVSFELK